MASEQLNPIVSQVKETTISTNQIPAAIQQQTKVIPVMKETVYTIPNEAVISQNPQQSEKKVSRWFWILLALTIGIVVIALLLWYYRNSCSKDSDCSKLCQNANYPCVAGCVNGRCQSNSVMCDIGKNQIWCPTLGQCIDQNTTCPLTPGSPSNVSNQAAAVDISGRREYSNTYLGSNNRQLYSCYSNILDKMASHNQIPQPSLQKLKEILSSAIYDTNQTGLAFQDVLSQKVIDAQRKGHLTFQDIQQYNQFIRHCDMETQKYIGQNNRCYENSNYMTNQKPEMEGNNYQQNYQQIHQQNYQQKQSDGITRDNVDKYVQSIQNIDAVASNWKPMGGGELYAKGRDGKTYKKDAYGNIQVRDSQGNWWVKGSADYWWLKDREGSIVKKDSQNNMWKQDLSGQVWKKNPSSQNRWNRVDVDIDRSADMNMQMDLARGKYIQSRGMNQGMSQGMNGYDSFNMANDWAYNGKDIQCSTGTTVDVYGNTFALNEPFHVNNGLIPSMMLPFGYHTGISTNISKDGTDPEFMGYGTSHKNYFALY